MVRNILIFLFWICSFSFAQIYKCENRNGAVIYTDFPCSEKREHLDGSLIKEIDAERAESLHAMIPYGSIKDSKREVHYIEENIQPSEPSFKPRSIADEVLPHLQRADDPHYPERLEIEIDPFLWKAFLTPEVLFYLALALILLIAIKIFDLYSYLSLWRLLTKKDHSSKYPSSIEIEPTLEEKESLDKRDREPYL